MIYMEQGKMKNEKTKKNKMENDCNGISRELYLKK